MAAASAWKVLWLTRLSQPASDRAIYQHICKHRPRSIMEIGLGDTTRAQRMISLALKYAAPNELRYIGIDSFEDRACGGPGVSLKSAYTILRPSGIKVNLIPGAANEALARSANSLRDIDLVVVSASQSVGSLEHAWFFLPRTLSPTAVLLHEDLKTHQHRVVTRIELERMAVPPRRRAA